LPSITGGVSNFETLTGLAFSGGNTTAPFAGGCAAGPISLDEVALGAGVGDETAGDGEATGTALGDTVDD